VIDTSAQLTEMLQKKGKLLSALGDLIEPREKCPFFDRKGRT